MSAPSVAPTRLIFAPFSLVAPLGLRFWDGVSARFVTSGLQVTAAPLANPARSIPATVSQSGIYAFPHLPGLHTVEFGAGDQAYWDTLPETARRDFVITVRDMEARFQAFVFIVRVPVRGIFNLTCPGANVTPAAPPASIALFSTPARPAPPSMAVIRTELRLANGQPAAWAVVAAQFDGQTLGHGLADRQGRVALIFPYPAPAVRAPLLQQTWSIQLQTFYTPPAPDVPPPELPDLCLVLQQTAVSVAPVPNTPVALRFDQALVIR